MSTMSFLLITTVMAALCSASYGVPKYDVQWEERREDFKFTADPSVVINNVTSYLTLACQVEGDLTGSDIMPITMGLLKGNGTDDVVLFPSDDPRITSRHNIGKDSQPNYISVTIADPSYNDEGLYKCTYFYLEKGVRLSRAFTTLNVTVQEPVPPTEMIDIITDVDEPREGCGCEGVKAEIHALRETLMLENQLLKEEVQRYNETLVLENQLLKDEIQTYREACRVSFSVRLPKDVPLKNMARIPFTDVISNKGEAFDEEKSVFVAPCTAQYYFSLTLRSYQAMDSGIVDGLILVDGDEVARTSVFIAEAIPNYQSATNGALVSLTEGQVVEVKVRTSSAGKLRGSTYSVFSGFYLFP